MLKIVLHRSVQCLEGQSGLETISHWDGCWHVVRLREQRMERIHVIARQGISNWIMDTREVSSEQVKLKFGFDKCQTTGQVHDVAVG